MNVIEIDNFSSLKKGDRAVILSVCCCGNGYRKKLFIMGVMPGVEFEFIRKAPFGDPVEIKINNTYLSLRKEEADLIKITKI